MTKIADLSIVELERRAEITRRAIASSAGLLTSRQAAEILGYTEAQLSHWLTGRGEPPEGLPKPLNGEKVTGCRRSNRPRNWIAAEVIAFARRRDLDAAGKVPCDHCDGTGRRQIKNREFGSYTVDCPRCSGQGAVPKPAPPPPSIDCPHCNGSGYTLGYRTGGGITPGVRPDVRRTCAWCRGVGRVRADLERPKPTPRPTGSDFSTSSEEAKPEPPRPRRPVIKRARDLVKAPKGAVAGANSPQASAPSDFAGQRVSQHGKDAA